MSILFPALLI